MVVPGRSGSRRCWEGQEGQLQQGKPNQTPADFRLGAGSRFELGRFNPTAESSWIRGNWPMARIPLLPCVAIGHVCSTADRGGEVPHCRPLSQPLAAPPCSSVPGRLPACLSIRASDAWRGRTGASHARGWGHFCGITLWARGRGWAHSTRGGRPKPARGKFPRSCRRSALISAHHKSRTLAAYVLLGRYFTDFLLCFKNKFCSRDGYFSPSNRSGSPAGRLAATPPARAAEPRLSKSLRAEIRNAGLQLRLVPHDDHPAPSWVFLTSRQALSTHGDPGRPMNSPMLYSHWRTAITFFH